MTAPGKDLAILTPKQKLMNALKDYAQTECDGRNIVVTDWAAVLFVEEFRGGEIIPSYMHLTSGRSSWHSLRGLVSTLADHVYRLKP